MSFTIAFKSLYTNIPIQDAFKLIKKLLLTFQNIIPSAHVVIELLDLVLHKSLIEINGFFFQQFFGIIMGTNVATILANLYCKNYKLFVKRKT